MVVGNLDFNRKELETVCRDNDIELLAIFGSLARGENRKDSDIDLLARFTKPKSLFELVDLEDRLSEVFGGKKTDLVTEGFLSPYIKDEVMNDLEVIYDN